MFRSHFHWFLALPTVLRCLIAAVLLKLSVNGHMRVRAPFTASSFRLVLQQHRNHLFTKGKAAGNKPACHCARWVCRENEWQQFCGTFWLLFCLQQRQLDVYRIYEVNQYMLGIIQFVHMCLQQTDLYDLTVRTNCAVRVAVHCISTWSLLIWEVNTHNTRAISGQCLLLILFGDARDKLRQKRRNQTLTSAIVSSFGTILAGVLDQIPKDKRSSCTQAKEPRWSTFLEKCSGYALFHAKNLKQLFRHGQTW